MGVGGGGGRGVRDCPTRATRVTGRVRARVQWAGGLGKIVRIHHASGASHDEHARFVERLPGAGVPTALQQEASA